jgi:hypothetical protein
METMKPMRLSLALAFVICASASGAENLNPYAHRTFTDATKADVWQSVIASLSTHDLPVVSADFKHGKIRARQHNYLNALWASCPPIDRRSFDPIATSNLGIRSAPLYRGVDLRLEVIETETGTQLSLDPRYYNVGRDNGRREFSFQTRCQSTGVLENALFNAAGSS